MNRDDIICLAREAAKGKALLDMHPEEIVPFLEAFAHMVEDEAESRTNRKANASLGLMCTNMVARERANCVITARHFSLRDDDMGAIIANAIRDQA